MVDTRKSMNLPRQGPTRIASKSISLMLTPSMERGHWTNRWEFLLSCVGLSVGLGNVWRFPYIAYKNGGAAFLLPYFILLVMVGKPMYFLEVAIGQYSQSNAVGVWLLCPLMQGVGYTMSAITLVVVTYYNVLMAYSLHYFYYSFRSELPWSGCFEWWNADLSICYVREKNMSRVHTKDGTKQSASEHYWEKYVLGLKKEVLSTGSIGMIRWELLIFLTAAWILVYVCLMRGIQSSGKAVYVTATFPYVVLLTMVVTGLMQEGAMSGVKYLFTPKFEALTNFDVWIRAAEQMFYSLSLSNGSLMVLGSYCEFRHRVDLDAMVVSVLDFCTSIISGIAVFSILGSLSNDINVPIDEVVSSGPGLAFIAYPEALSRLPFPQFFSALFFLMLLTLGLGSEIALCQSIITIFYDRFPKLRRKKSLVVLVGAMFCYLIGLTCITEDGQFVFDLLDQYGGSGPLIIAAVTECFTIFYLYGVETFMDDIHYMLGKRPSLYWRVGWMISPIFLFTIFLLSWKDIQTKQFYAVDYPPWAEGAGWFIYVVIIAQIPIFAVIHIRNTKKKEAGLPLVDYFLPHRKWRPGDPTEVSGRIQFNDQGPLELSLMLRRCAARHYEYHGIEKPQEGDRIVPGSEQPQEPKIPPTTPESTEDAVETVGETGEKETKKPEDTKDSTV